MCNLLSQVKRIQKFLKINALTIKKLQKNGKKKPLQSIIFGSFIVLIFFFIICIFKLSFLTEIYLALLKHNWQIKTCMCTWCITYNVHILNVKWLQSSWIIKCLGAWFPSSWCLFVFEHTLRPRSNFIFLNASFQFPTLVVEETHFSMIYILPFCWRSQICPPISTPSIFSIALCVGLFASIDHCDFAV